MKVLAAFFRLIRWPNLVFIALTQVLFEFCIYRSIYPVVNADGSEISRFILLMLASVLIAAAGYIINDYFDLNIDQVNKPDKVVVNTIISRRWVIFWHMFLSLLGLFFTVSALPMNDYWHLVLANLASIILLWFYSTTLKKQLLIGNVLISLLTAWVILVIFFSKYPLSIHSLLLADKNEVRFFRYAILYASFAFVISLIREVVKDMEDREGDRKYGCRTMPIVWGLNASKVFVAVWVIVLVAVLGILQVYVIPFGWWHSALYCLLLIILPLLWVLRQLYRANSAEDFHQISTVIKLVMLTGIVSMFFFRIYLVH
ncbi:MAG: geranylgeranylglycerol-phosphate geranylgeranyltransferase [Chitinophagaceae bacterium]|nr:geranylgeranylglycerol-phosphate geranylgeranyltransferase [Chitinophagaceae bacterium]MCA6451857.1 geranylgeranylglycerol-phosphate geranylgeranyltransferase [Chitinophagaceae bacterium]MCA6457962.1 geranylgeranylglycerol-phosphate geranylgeranyltransferase [Chitinophagaceae bacterium]MCA6463675.1 geranylgeranylglycerol-phosphate geranylgeranyltransferase [Chitinophagaceae bacterium]MEA3427057.1 geranylgeranylglycerol-phosphate geranylgeranyltransferase [Bacteroidota bacterium]